MPKKGRRVGIYTYVNPEDSEKLSDMSRETGTSISGLVRQAVKEWLKKKPSKS